MNRHRLPVCCALTTLLVRIVIFSFFQDSLLYLPNEGSQHDRSIYMEAAEAASNGIFFPEGAFQYLPLYPWVLGLLGTVTGTGPAAAAFLGMACDVLTTLLIVLFARKLGASNLLAGIAGLLFAAYPLAAIYSVLAMPNTLNTLGVTAFVFASYRLLEGPTCRAHTKEDKAKPAPLYLFFMIGLFAGIATLGFAGMILIAGTVAFIAWRKTRAWTVPALIIVGMAIPIAPVAIHNSKAEGSFVMLTTHGGFNFYMGNHERATGYPLKVMNFRMTAKEMLEDAHRHAEQSAGREMTRAESSSWWNDQAKNYWKAHPLEAAVLTVKKAALFWNMKDMDDLRILEQLRITDSFFRHYTGTPFLLFSVFGLVGLIYARGTVTVRAALLAGMIGVVFFFITARYRLTFTPLMAVIGAAGFTRVTAALREGTRLPLLIIAGAIGFVCIPFPVRDQRPVDHHNVAIQLIARERLDEAFDVINRGIAIDPNFGSLYAAKGNVRFMQEHYEEAADAYKTAQVLSPGNPTTLYNLALSLARMGDYCGARDALSGQRLDGRSAMLFKELAAACSQ